MWVNTAVALISIKMAKSLQSKTPPHSSLLLVLPHFFSLLLILSHSYSFFLTHTHSFSLLLTPPRSFSFFLTPTHSLHHHPAPHTPPSIKFDHKECNKWKRIYNSYFLTFPRWFLGMLSTMKRSWGCLYWAIRSCKNERTHVIAWKPLFFSIGTKSMVVITRKCHQKND